MPSHGPETHELEHMAERLGASGVVLHVLNALDAQWVAAFGQGLAFDSLVHWHPPLLC